MNLLLKHYNEAVSSQRLEDDAAQRALAIRLDDLSTELKKNDERGFFSGLFTRQVVKGLYIWGSVGRGKTMLMDLFFVDVAITKKQRVHFHAFMRDVHQSIFEERQKGTYDPLQKTALRLAKQVQLLCFDEFAVTDVADAMILGRLFTLLFDKGVTVVATSNSAPDALYKDGLNRPLFLPFIALIENKMDVLQLSAKKDFRLEKLERSGVYFTGQDATQKFDEAWHNFARHEKIQPEILRVKGRMVDIPLAASGAARLRFANLCEAALGTEDYLELSRAFHTVFLENIPFFTPEKRNALRRFINLVDVLYDHGVNLIASAASEPRDLVKDMDGYEGEAFARTASRLNEMRSSPYLAKAHLPHVETLENEALSG
ncbi:MAG: cell division protein ZapE [Pseudomonadota bacterium]